MSRTPVNELVGEDLLYQIWEDLPPYAEEHMRAVFIDHDEEAASRLISAAPNEWRGHIAHCAFLLGVSNPAYRAIGRLADWPCRGDALGAGDPARPAIGLRRAFDDDEVGIGIFVRRVWDHDHSQLLYAVDGDASRVREILTAADFAIPFHGSQAVYRGAPDVSPEVAVEGLSWTITSPHLPT